MSAKTYVAKFASHEEVTFRADLEQAGAGIFLSSEDGWVSTPFRTADARHDAWRAAKLLADWGAIDERGAQLTSIDEVAK
jgi:hypothetical protein